MEVPSAVPFLFPFPFVFAPVPALVPVEAAFADRGQNPAES